MSVGNAIKLLKTIGHDSDLRNGIYKCSNTDNFNSYLQLNGYDCNYEELDEAINSQHVLCQTLEEAQELMNKAELLRFLFKNNL
jgi:hypothetical protein